jgi:hypothetical protein
MNIYLVYIMKSQHLRIILQISCLDIKIVTLERHNTNILFICWNRNTWGSLCNYLIQTFKSIHLRDIIHIFCLCVEITTLKDVIQKFCLYFETPTLMRENSYILSVYWNPTIWETLSVHVAYMIKSWGSSYKYFAFLLKPQHLRGKIHIYCLYIEIQPFERHYPYILPMWWNLEGHHTNILPTRLNANTWES